MRNRLAEQIEKGTYKTATHCRKDVTEICSLVLTKLWNCKILDLREQIGVITQELDFSRHGESLKPNNSFVKTLKDKPTCMHLP